MDTRDTQINREYWLKGKVSDLNPLRLPDTPRKSLDYSSRQNVGLTKGSLSERRGTIPIPLDIYLTCCSTIYKVGANRGQARCKE